MDLHSGPCCSQHSSLKFKSRIKSYSTQKLTAEVFYAVKL